MSMLILLAEICK